METNNDHPSNSGHPGTALLIAPASSASDDINLLDMFLVLARRKRLLLTLPLTVAVLAAGVSMMLPNIYTATTKLLPPPQAQSGASALLSQLGGVSGLTGMSGVKAPADLYIGIMKSRTIADKLIARFDLKKVYGTDSAEKARRHLAQNTVLIAGKDGLITVEVDDKDPKFVAKLANGYVEELQLLTKTLAVTEASQRRLFFERQLETAKDKLAKVEMSLKGAMDSGGVISVDSESQAILETAARLKAQVSAKEIQLGSMRAFVTAQNPEFMRASAELRSLRNELAKLEGGRAGTGAVSGNRSAGLENIQLMRDLKYYQMLYELLAKQYESARLEEAKDSSQIQVLDAAIEPEFKAKPKRALIVLSATIFGFFAAAAWALLSSLRQRAMAVPEHEARWKELQAHLWFK